MLGQVPAIKEFDRVIWIDTDIVINARLAPDITKDVPIEKIGIVELTDTPQIEANTETLNSLYNIVLREHFDEVHDFVKPVATLDNHYAAAGLSPAPKIFCNTGVFVFSPKHHNEFFMQTYLKYDRNFDDYENTPLSFEIFSNNLNHGIDPRFNTLWSEEVSAKYPFLARRDILDDFYARVKGGESLDGGLYAQWYTWCTNASFQSAYFLHFSGGRNNPLTKVPMRFVQPEAENVFGATFPEYYDDIQQAKPSTHGSPFSHRQIDGD